VFEFANATVQPINCWVEPDSAYPATNHAPLAPLEPASHEPGSGAEPSWLHPATNHAPSVAFVYSWPVGPLSFAVRTPGMALLVASFNLQWLGNYTAAALSYYIFNSMFGDPHDAGLI
jgi:hypothetical protein